MHQLVVQVPEDEQAAADVPRARRLSAKGAKLELRRQVICGKEALAVHLGAANGNAKGASNQRAGRSLCCEEDRLSVERAVVERAGCKSQLALEL